MLNIVNIYGAAHAKDKQGFFIELVLVLGCNKFLFLVGSDFNIIRKFSECNKSRRLPKWSLLFNAIIENWELKEVDRDVRMLTWPSKNQDDPTKSKLDIILMSD